MISARAVVLSAALAGVLCSEELEFPPGFKFGVASSAYQVEGAWNASDKSESIWDRYTHVHPSAIGDGGSGDVACDSYHRWEDDVTMLHHLGVHFYRFSISWPRLLPSGFSEHVSEDGARYYSELIDALLEKGIEPVVTLYHWDLPQRLQDLGGWANPLVSEWFAQYARVVFSLYGARVKTWVTVNEPWVMCDVPYLAEGLAPGVRSELGAHLCVKHALLAHARAWRLYDREFRHLHHGVVSLANQAMWLEPWNSSDAELAELVRQYQEGRLGHPVFSAAGGWPGAVRAALAEYSAREGYPTSVLPDFTPEEADLVRGTYDFYGLNFYSGLRVRRAREHEVLRPWPGDAPMFNAKLELDPAWPPLVGLFVYYPEGLRKQLAWLKQQYGDIPILITENGCGSSSAELQDVSRVEYLENYLKQVLLSVREDGVNVTGYTAWTLMDNFEWGAGYSVKFGLYEVDFSSPLRTRTARASAHYYGRVVRARSLAVPAPRAATSSPSGEQSSSPGGESCSWSYVALCALAVGVLVALAGGVLACRARRPPAAARRKAEYEPVNNNLTAGDKQPAHQPRP